MTDTKQFKSVLASEFEAFAYEHQVNGYKSRSTFETLYMLDTYLHECGHQDKTIPLSIYRGWLEQMKNVASCTLYGRACTARRFIIYINALGYECPVPMLPKKYGSDFTPYIFSQEEMSRIFEACDSYRDPHASRKSSIFLFPTIIRVLYSTGMRVGEAIKIKNKDVDFKNHIIKLGFTKNNRERLCPINDSLEKVMRQYLSFRSRLPVEGLDAPDSYFFVGLSGKKTKSITIWHHFHQILIQLGIRDSINGGYPRVHDLRHTACVHAMKKLIENGKDIYCHIGVLSAFLGHVKVSDTEHYIRLTKDVYPELIKQDAVVTAAIHNVIKRSLLVHDYENEY